MQQNDILKQKLLEYRNDKIDIETLIHFFDTNNYTNKEIKENGIVYTPKYISDYIISKIKPRLEETIFEPSVGHGIFIISLLEYIQKTYSLTNEELKNYFIQKVYGQDLQQQNIKELKSILIAYFFKKNIILSDDTFTKLFVGDTLFSQKQSFDIIVGNPPYVRTKNIESTYLKKLRKEYFSCSKGNIDLYYAFIEFAFQHSKRCSFIIPNSWIYNSSAKNLRFKIKDNLLEVIDFKQKKIFDNASTYTSIFFIDKNKHIDKIEYKEDLNSNYINVLKKDLKDERWVFKNEYIKSLNLNTIDFNTPIATLRDKVYITNDIDTNDMISFYKISKIKNETDFFNSEQKIIFPYKKENNKYIIKSETELDNKTFDYLNKNKKELLKRDKGKQAKYENWFAFGRKQGLNTFSKDNIIIIPGMISQTFKFFSISLSKIKQPFLFSSGFIIEVDDCEKNILLDFLNSKDFSSYLKNNGKIWKGKTEDTSYYSLSIKQLKYIFNSNL